MVIYLSLSSLITSTSVSQYLFFFLLFTQHGDDVNTCPTSCKQDSTRQTIRVKLLCSFNVQLCGDPPSISYISTTGICFFSSSLSYSVLLRWARLSGGSSNVGFTATACAVTRVATDGATCSSSMELASRLWSGSMTIVMRLRDFLYDCRRSRFPRIATSSHVS